MFRHDTTIEIDNALRIRMHDDYMWIEEREEGSDDWFSRNHSGTHISFDAQKTIARRGTHEKGVKK